MAKRKWEYMIKRIDPKDYPIHDPNEFLNSVGSELEYSGSEGWELVSVFPQEKLWFVFMKREKQESPPEHGGVF